jgi:hypothetical protein
MARGLDICSDGLASLRKSHLLEGSRR